MKLIYISNTKMPHTRAHSIQVAKMSEAFSKHIHTTLIVPLSMNSSREKTYSKYNVKSRFNLLYMPSLDLIFLNLGMFFFYLQSLTFSAMATLYSLFLKKDMYYTRDIFTAYFLCNTRFMHKSKVIYEAHGEPSRFENFFFKRTVGRLDGIAALSSFVIDYHKDKSKKVFLAPDGVDVGMFSLQKDKNELKSSLNLAKDKKIVMYSGHLYSHKGIYTFLDSAKYLSSDFALYVLGGTPEDIKAVRNYMQSNSITNVTLLGYMDYSKVADYVASADILVLPNSGKNIFSSKYTSPLKLFEYMASGNIIVSSDVPSLREVLNENNSILFNPDDPKALAEGIKKASSQKNSKLAEKAKQDVLAYSWDVRAKNIIEFAFKKQI